MRSTRYLTENVPEPATWMAKGHRFYYRKSEKGRFQFVVVDADTRQKQPAFDHDRLAAALTKGTGQIQTAARLPFTTFTFSADEKTIQFMTGPDERWQCTLADYVCRKSEPAPARPGEFAGMGGPRNPELARYQQPRPSPDGTLEAFIENFNLAVRSMVQEEDRAQHRRVRGQRLRSGSIVWSPDSKKLAAYRVRAGLSPRDPLHRVVAGGPGAAQAVVDAVREARRRAGSRTAGPVRVDPAARIDVASDLFPNAYELSDLVWWKDSRALTFEYNQRGHQVYRIIEVDARQASAGPWSPRSRRRSSTTTEAKSDRTAGKRFRHDVADGQGDHLDVGARRMEAPVSLSTARPAR